MAEMTLKRTRGRPRLSDMPDSGQVQSLDRAILILKLLSQGNGMSLTEISRTQDLPASTAYRMLTTLQHHGAVEFEEASQLWFVGVETFRMGAAFTRRRKLAERGHVVIQELMQATGETANLALAEADGVVFVSQVETHEPIRAFFRPGTRSPYHVSGIGKAILAGMSEGARAALVRRLVFERFTEKTLKTPAELETELAATRLRGFALDDEERNLGMRCVAAAIFNELGEPVGGVSISGPTVRLPDSEVGKLGMIVAAAGAEITAAMGGLTPRWR